MFGTLIVLIILLGMLHPFIVLAVFAPARPVENKMSLVESIYKSLIMPRMEFTGKQYTLTLPSNASVMIIKARSSIIKIEDNCLSQVLLKDLANIPSDYILHIRNGTVTLTIIGYYAEINLPCNVIVLRIDSRITYLGLNLSRSPLSVLDIHLLGSVAKLYSIIDKPLAMTIRLEDSLIEVASKYYEYSGEGSIEIKATSSIAYLNVFVPRDTKLRLVKSNVGGVIDVLIDGSKVIEIYYVDEGYYEAKTRLHVGIAGIGSGIRVDVIRGSR